MTLYDFQETGVSFLMQGRYQKLLGDEMGLGKTVIAAVACERLDARRIHVVCPAVAKYNWQKELFKFAGILADVADDGDPIAHADVVISSFEYAKKFQAQYLKTPRDVLIVDEAHYLKEPTAKRTKTVLGKSGLIHNAARFWALTGTPAPNHAGELWVLLYSFGITKLSYERFVDKYCITRNVSGDRYSRIQIVGTNTQMSHELRAMLDLCMLRRLKADVLDLPPVFHTVYHIKGDTDAAIFKAHPELRDKVRAELLALQEKLDFFGINPSDEKLLNVLSLMSQSVSSLRRYTGLKKIKPAAELIRQELLAQEYKKIIVFGVHRDVLDTLNLELSKDFETVIAHGGVSSRKKIQAQDKFQDDPKCQVFIGNIAAAGTNLTLTAANQVTFIEDDWVPGNNAQAADRAHRIGQLASVTVRHLALRDSIDTKIAASLTRKAQEISTFLK